MKRINDLSKLAIGTKYRVECDIWKADLIYCGHVHSDKDYTFTFGETVDSWRQNFNVVAPKSRLKIYAI